VIYELRSYWVEPTFLNAYITWVNEKAQPLQRGKFGFRVIGFWTVEGEDGTIAPDGPNVVWMTAWEDRAERDRVWADLRSSPEWAAIREGISNFMRQPGNVKFLEGLACSPLK